MHKIDEIQCSLEKTSLDDRYNVTKEYMTHSQLRVCAFDDVKNGMFEKRYRSQTQIRSQ